MADDTLDIAVARYVRTAGLATAEQVSAAMQEQSRRSTAGTPISFSEALLNLGFITAAQRAMVEQKAQGKGGVQQLLHYKLLKKLGEGGMGAVYLAEDLQGKRQVAVKILPRQHSDNRELVKRFQREAEAAVRLKHPNIVQGYASGEDLGYHFYVMEYCKGQPLDALLKKQGPLPVDRAARIVLQTALGLKSAHDHGVIHRDIKPANIILAEEGEAKILDLGLSKNLVEGEKSFRTQTGAIMGTPHYISPEQAQGEKSIDGRTDLYSLGGTFYHLITGKTPFDGASALEIMSKHVTGQLPNPQELREGIPDAVVAVIARMMAKDPADRYASCAELIADLKELSNGGAPKTLILDARKTTIAPIQRRLAARITRRSVAPRPQARAPKIAAVVTGASALLAGGLWVASGFVPPVAPARPGPVSVSAVSDETARELLRTVMARLKKLNPEFSGKERSSVIEHGEVVELNLISTGLTDLSPLQSLRHLKRLEACGRWDETQRVAEPGQIKDLSPLADLPLVALGLQNNPSIFDLSPLRKMKLAKLNLGSTGVSEIRNLSGMPLQELRIYWTQVSDLSPLKSAPLRVIEAEHSQVSDLTPLGTLPLVEATFKDSPIRDYTVLGGIQTLKTINEMPAAEFLKQNPPFPSSGSRPAPPSSTPRLQALPAPEAWATSANLLPSVDPSMDAIEGSWTFQSSDLVSSEGVNVRLQLPYRPPEEYDVRLEFTATGESPDVNLILSTQGHNFSWLLGSYANTLMGFGWLPDLFPDKDVRNVIRSGCLETGRRYVTIVQVRRTGVAGWLDGVKILELGPEYQALRGAKSTLTDELRIGLASFKCSAHFHVVRVLDVTGKGVLMRSPNR